MKANEIYNTLTECINIYRSILITGPWGIGKTHYAKKYADDNDKSTIYVSVFGKENSDQVKSEIGYQLMPKDAKHISKVYNWASNIMEKNNLIGISVNLPTLYKNDIKVYKKRYLNEEKLTIIFDDLERKSEKYKMADLLGLLDEILKINDVNIVVLANEEKLSPEDKTGLEKFKEKVVERTYYIHEYSEDALGSIIYDSINEKFLNNYKKEIDNFINTFLSEHKTKNLRTIILASKFSNEVFLKIDNKYLTKTNFIEILEVCFSVVIENVEQAHLHTGEEKNDESGFNLMKEINKDINQRICHHYLNGALFQSNFQHQFVDPINNFFHDSNKNENIETINYLIKTKRKAEDKHNFYKAKDQLITQINEFNDNYVAKKSKTDFITWLHNLDIQYIWIEHFNYVPYDEKSLHRRIDEYLNSYVDINKHIYNNRINSFCESYQSAYVINLINNINKEIEYLYYFKLLQSLRHNFKLSIYKNTNYIDALIEFIKEINLKKLAGKDLEDFEIKIENEIYNVLKNNQWFFPMPVDEIDEEQWCWCRKVWSMLSLFDHSKQSKFIAVMMKSLKKYDEVFKNRIEQLQQANKIID